MLGASDVIRVGEIRMAYVSESTSNYGAHLSSFLFNDLRVIWVGFQNLPVMTPIFRLRGVLPKDPHRLLIEGRRMVISKCCQDNHRGSAAISILVQQSLT